MAGWEGVRSENPGRTGGNRPEITSTGSADLSIGYLSAYDHSPGHRAEFAFAAAAHETPVGADIYKTAGCQQTGDGSRAVEPSAVGPIANAALLPGHDGFSAVNNAIGDFAVADHFQVGINAVLDPRLEMFQDIISVG